jgi:hypothetical protein
MKNKETKSNSTLVSNEDQNLLIEGILNASDNNPFIDTTPQEQVLSSVSCETDTSGGIQFETCSRPRRRSA